MSVVNPDPKLRPGISGLLNEPPLVVLSGLKYLFGPHEAEILQLVAYWRDQPFTDHWLSLEMRVKTHQGRPYVRIAPRAILDRWTGRLRHMSEKTFDRKVASCRQQGLLLTANLNSDPRDTTNWYAIVDEALEPLCALYDDFLRRVKNERREHFEREGEPLPRTREDQLWREFQQQLQVIREGMDAHVKKMDVSLDDDGEGQFDPTPGHNPLLSSGPVMLTCRGKSKATRAKGQKDRVRRVKLTPSPYITEQQQSVNMENITDASDDDATAPLVVAALDVDGNDLNVVVVVTSELPVESPESQNEIHPVSLNSTQNSPQAESQNGNLPIPTWDSVAVPKWDSTESQEDGAFAPLNTTIMNVVNDLKNDVVVEDDELLDEPHDSTREHPAAVKEMLAEGIMLTDATALFGRYGERECFAALDDPKKLDRMLDELRSKSVKAEPKKATTPAPPANLARSTATGLGMPAGAFPLPSSDIEERMTVLWEMQQAADNMDTRAAEKLIEQFGPFVCRIGIAALSSTKADDPARYLTWAIRNHQKLKSGQGNARTGHAPVEESYDQAVATAQSNAAAYARQQQADKNAEMEAVKMDALWNTLSEINRTKIDQIVGKRMGNLFTMESHPTAWVAMRRDLQRAAMNGQLNEIYQNECGTSATVTLDAQEKTG